MWETKDFAGNTKKKRVENILDVDTFTFIRKSISFIFLSYVLVVSSSQYFPLESNHCQTNTMSTHYHCAGEMKCAV